MTGGPEPSAQDAFRALMRDHIVPALRERGFKGTAVSGVFWSLTGVYATEIAFVKSRHSSRASVDFWAELAVHYVPDEREIWDERTSGLVPIWEFPGEWTVSAGQPVEPVAASILDGFARYVWPALQTTYEHHRYPADDGRRWARTFPELPENNNRDDDQPLAVVTLLTGGIPLRAELMTRARSEHERLIHEPPLVLEYLSRLQHHPDYGVRSDAAERLRLVAHQPEVRAALRQAEERDEYWAVRWHASYSLKLADAIAGSEPPPT